MGSGKRSILPRAYSPRAWRGKPLQTCIANRNGLPETADTPLFGTVSRLAEQKA